MQAFDVVSTRLALDTVIRISLSLATAAELKLIKYGDQIRDVLAKGTLLALNCYVEESVDDSRLDFALSIPPWETSSFLHQPLLS